MEQISIRFSKSIAFEGAWNAEFFKASVDPLTTEINVLSLQKRPGHLTLTFCDTSPVVSPSLAERRTKRYREDRRLSF